MTVRVLLDVDGVLNAVDTDPDTFPDMVEDIAMGFSIHYSPTVARFMTELAEMADVLWLTTWEDLANEWISPMMDMPKFELAGVRDHVAERETRTWWKLKIARELWEQDQTPFVWLDDDLKDDRESMEWLRTLDDQAIVPPYLAVSPDTRVGLTQSDLDWIYKYVDVFA